MVAAAILKVEKLQNLGNGLTDLDEIWHNDTSRTYGPSQVIKIQEFKNPKRRRRPPCKIEKSSISTSHQV